MPNIIVAEVRRSCAASPPARKSCGRLRPRPRRASGEAIETMIDRKVGSAIVCEGERVLGVFTTIDALRALHALLERR